MLNAHMSCTHNQYTIKFVVYFLQGVQYLGKNEVAIMHYDGTRYCERRACMDDGSLYSYAGGFFF